MKEIFAWMGDGPNDGILGLMSGDLSNGIPLICASKKLAMKLRPFAEAAAAHVGRSARLVRFVEAETIVTVDPQPHRN